MESLAYRNSSLSITKELIIPSFIDKINAMLSYVYGTLVPVRMINMTDTSDYCKETSVNAINYRIYLCYIGK